MHRDHGEVELGRHRPPFKTGWKNFRKQWPVFIWPGQSQSEDNGKPHPEKHGNQGQKIILKADDFVIQAKHPFPNKSGRGRMDGSVRMRGLRH